MTESLKLFQMIKSSVNKFSRSTEMPCALHVTQGIFTSRDRNLKNKSERDDKNNRKAR